MQNIFTNIKCSEIILSNANENWYIILYDLFSRLCYIATCGPFCKDATHMYKYGIIICMFVFEVCYYIFRGGKLPSKVTLYHNIVKNYEKFKKILLD